ncbi:MAG: hypothetical protein WAX66_04025 [Patescibacteria group bacterium]
MKEQQIKLFRFINEFRTRNGQGPTFDEMKLHIGLKSNQVVDNLLSELTKLGYIERRKGIPRGINIVRGVEEFVLTPECATVTKYTLQMQNSQNISNNLWRLDGSN